MLAEYEKQHRDFLTHHLWERETCNRHISRLAINGTYAKDSQYHSNCLNVADQYICVPKNERNESMVMAQIYSQYAIRCNGQ
jgi:hypothetical protein